MITSNQLLILLEDYFKDHISGSRKRYTIFKNPGSTDIVDMQKNAKKQRRSLEEVRFIADSRDKSIYIADAYLCTHADIHIGLRSWGQWDEQPFLDGVAKVNGTSLSMIKWDKYDQISTSRYILQSRYYNYFLTIVNTDWSWVDRYVSGCSNLMKHYKDNLSKINPQ